jgi:alpha-glucan,water dikinase
MRVEGMICVLFVQVGAKSRNIANLRGKLPSWIRLPTSVALPFGVFEKVLAETINKVSKSV